jgi:aryl-alcohol dehydrogenase-like predicted oxidoreductase
LTIPIPGFKTVAQVEENVGAMAHGPLSAEQMRRIDEIVAGG